MLNDDVNLVQVVAVLDELAKPIVKKTGLFGRMKGSFA
jgi:hypothetical protein